VQALLTCDEADDYLFETGNAPSGQDRLYMQQHARRLAYSFILFQRFAPGAARILDVGGGPGYIGFLCTKLQPTIRYVVVEDPRVSSTHHEVVACDIDGGDLPLPDGAFDFVFNLEVLEHLLRNPFKMLTECHRVLAESGLMLIGTPNLGSIAAVVSLLRGRSPGYSPIKEDIYGRHNKEYVIPELRSLASAAGFTIDHEETAIDNLPLHYRLVARGLSLSHIAAFPYELQGPQYWGVWRKTHTPSDDPPVAVYAPRDEGD
jgi:SAM-dependent methyltransferase